MRGYRFLLSRRWIVFALVVVLLAYSAWLLGLWQWHRLEDRKTTNAIVIANEGLAPAPVGDVLAAPGGVLDATRAWRTVTATGTYDVAHTIIVRYRGDDHSQSGVDVVVPLVPATGPAVLVDRGFLVTEATPQTPDDVPAPPSGEVTVTGYARVDGTGSSVAVIGQSTRAISSLTIASALQMPLYGGFVQAASESPAASTAGAALEANDLPDLSNGPHFFYALQWWFFGLLAVGGFGYLAYDERQRGPRGQRDPRVAGVPVTPVSTPRAASQPQSARPVREKKARQTNVPAQYQRPRKQRTP